MIEGYLPRLAARAGAPPWTGMLYAKGQSPFHAAVSRRYFDVVLAGGEHAVVFHDEEVGRWFSQRGT